MTWPTDAAEAVVAAVHAGDLAQLEALLAAHPGLADEPLGGRYGTRTPLHAVADWPGFWPRGADAVRALVAAGAAPDGGPRQPGDETPLHWAASSDDAEVAAALLDAGADPAAPAGSIGTPLENAVGYGCWDVARLLVARGAPVEQAWVAAAMGLVDRMDELLGDEPSGDAVSEALWHACGGGRWRAAAALVARGGDLGWTPPYAHGTPLDAARGDGTQRRSLVEWLERLGAPSAAASGGDPQAAWTAVDALFAERLLRAEPALDAALAASGAAGLPAIAVAPVQGALLRLLARAAGARRILEVGTLGGYSTLWLAGALPPDGTLVTLELDPRHAEVARANLAAAGLEGRVEVVVGPAIESLASLEPGFDLAFIDADKPSNADYVREALRLCRPGALIVVDNVARAGRVVTEPDDPSVQGVLRLLELVRDEPRLEATAVQTVGAKGWDGFLIARVG